MQVKLGYNLVFRDSFMFLTCSLESLVQLLRKTDESQFKHLESLMNTRYPASDYKLLLRKGVFPYEYLDSLKSSTITNCPFARSYLTLCKVISAPKKTTTTLKACGWPSDALHSRTISNYTWRATCAS